MFPVIETERLRLRPPVESDAAAFHERRNHPDVARYQNWVLPYPMEKVKALIAPVLPDEVDVWHTIVIEERETGQTLGDLAVGMSWEGRCAEVGYSLDREAWGRGIATEAVDALVAHLFEVVGVTRAMGTLHPANTASARVLERTGFLFEGHTRLSFWVGDDNSDDHIYGMTRSDWDAWRNRPRTEPTSVALVEITPDSAREVYRLQTHKTQEALVAPMPDSFADALFPEVVNGAPVRPWMRAIQADGVLVGFVMMTEPTPAHPEPFLWRLLIDRLHQRRGIGERVIELLEGVCLSWKADSLAVSWSTAPGSPERFYMRCGFVPTGRLIEGEVEARKYLD